MPQNGHPSVRVSFALSRATVFDAKHTIIWSLPSGLFFLCERLYHQGRRVGVAAQTRAAAQEGPAAPSALSEARMAEGASPFARASGRGAPENFLGFQKCSSKENGEIEHHALVLAMQVCARQHDILLCYNFCTFPS